MRVTTHAKSTLITFLAICVLFLLPADVYPKPKILTVGTGRMMGNYHPTGLAIAKVVNTRQGNEGFYLEVLETGGSNYNLEALQKGNMQFGMVQADRQYEAIKGLVGWQPKGPLKKLRSIFSTYTESVTLVASLESEIKSIEDLKGKRVDIRLPGSGAHQNAIDVLSNAGIDWKKDIIAYEGETFKGPSLLHEGVIDAFFHTVGHPSNAIRFATASIKRARLIPIINTGKLLSRYPYYSKSIIPKRYYRSAFNQSDVETIGVKATFVTVTDVPEDIVYAVTKAVFEDFGTFRSFSTVLSNVKKEGMLEGLSAPLHPGALRYYKEAGVPIPTSLR